MCRNEVKVSNYDEELDIAEGKRDSVLECISIIYVTNQELKGSYDYISKHLKKVEMGRKNMSDKRKSANNLNLDRFDTMGWSIFFLP